MRTLLVLAVWSTVAMHLDTLIRNIRAQVSWFHETKLLYIFLHQYKILRSLNLAGIALY